MDQGVDLFLNGHEHNYERNWPTYRGNSTQSNVEPTAPIYIVTGLFVPAAAAVMCCGDRSATPPEDNRRSHARLLCRRRGRVHRVA